MQILIEHCEENKIPYRIDAIPTKGYTITKLTKKHFPWLEDIVKELEDIKLMEAEEALDRGVR